MFRVVQVGTVVAALPLSAAKAYTISCLAERSLDDAMEEKKRAGCLSELQTKKVTEGHLQGKGAVVCDVLDDVESNTMLPSRFELNCASSCCLRPFRRRLLYCRQVRDLTSVGRSSIDSIGSLEIV